MNKALESALKKVRKFDGGTWVGYLRPDEILALKGDGAGCRQDEVDRAMDKKLAGDCKATWFYFTLGRTKPYSLTKEKRDGDPSRRFHK